MKQQVIMDIGPLVAFLNSRDKRQDWVKAQRGKFNLSCWRRLALPDHYHSHWHDHAKQK
jgi:hypothetical protein